MSHFYIRKPQFRSGCEIATAEDHLKILYRGDEFVVYPEGGQSVSSISRFLQLLNGEQTVEELQTALPEMTPEQVMEYLQVLDGQWLLKEGESFTFDGKRGIDFFMEVEDFYRDLERASGETELTARLLDGQASNNLVVGWAFEYYHVTRRAHDCISPAIAKGKGPIRDQLIEFFNEEYRHDKLLLKSLESMGFSREEVMNSIPLPFTAAVSNLLAKWAHTDLLSFMAGLFVFEGSPLSGNEYLDALNGYELPEGFAAHQATHTHINTDGEHGAISRDFYSLVEYVTPAEQQRVLRNIRMLHETNLLMHAGAVQAYDHPDAVMPRVLATLR